MEEWLGKVEDAMFNSLRKLIKTSMQVGFTFNLKSVEFDKYLFNIESLMYM